MSKVRVMACKCNECGHIWLPRSFGKLNDEFPAYCAKCKSAYWNRKRKIRKNNKK